MLGNPFYRGVGDNLGRLFRGDKRNWKPNEEVTPSNTDMTPVRREFVQRKLIRITS